MRPHISFSELNEFANGCQWRWKLNYVDGHRQALYKLPFDFGTAIHAALEAHYRRKNPISLEHAVKVFRKKLKWLFKKHSNGVRVWDYNSKKWKLEGYDQPETLGPSLDQGENILRKFDKCEELKDAEVLWNEYPLFEPIDRTDGIDIKFKGYVDVVIRAKAKNGKTVLYVADFKTCSWGWDGDKRQDKWTHFQVFLYKHFIAKKHDLDPSGIRTAFVLLKKKPPKGVVPVEFFPVSAGPVSVQRALDALNSALTEMKDREKDNSYKKNRDMCTDKFGNKCPFLNTPHCT